jgi:NAD(P)-dependent dehydrogenase (short-subunit alcohol dehydrogenase family)
LTTTMMSLNIKPFDVKHHHYHQQPNRGSTMGALTDKVALITGGNSGIGLATAHQFVADGAYVFITARRQKELDEAVAAIGKNARGIAGDVANLSDLDRIMATIQKVKGHLDIVFANAGVAAFQKLGDITESEFDRHFDINVKGTLFTIQKSLPLLRDGGAIIMTSSVVGSKGLGNNSVYSATKAALRSFARTFTTDLKERKIRVNVVSPGPIHTPGLETLIGAAGDQLEAAFAGSVPLGRAGRAEEIAKAVSFLASDAASYVAGSELFVDGGFAQV